MGDHFDEVMRKFLVPMHRLIDGPSDAMYFLHKKGGRVFSEGYAHPVGGMYGALIKYPDPNGHIELFGRKFNWTHREYVNGELTIVPYDEQVRRMMEILPELKNRPPRPLYAQHFCHFYLEEMQGYFDPMHSLRLLIQSSRRLDEIIGSLDGLLGVPRDRIGCTGSLAYGYFEEPAEDVDSLFFGTVKENAAVIARIRELKKREPEREVVELGKSWPLRFKHMNTVICPFFKYSRRDEIPLREFQMTVLKDRVTASGKVVDDRHTPYLPAILTLDEVTIDGGSRPPIELVIYNGSERGEYFNGMRLEFRGRLVGITKGAETREVLLATMPGEVRRKQSS